MQPLMDVLVLGSLESISACSGNVLGWAEVGRGS